MPIGVGEVFMSSRDVKCLPGKVCTIAVAGFLLAMPADRAASQNKPDPQKVPYNVMAALKAKFPKAEIDKWSREKERGAVVYDFEFKQDGRKFEADIKEDGAIDNWEKQIPTRDLPGAVRKAAETKYPKAEIREVMVVTAVKSGRDTLEGYEIVLKASGQKPVEVTFAPDGKILEEAGEEK
jgi:hypothetical protein